MDNIPQVKRFLVAHQNLFFNLQEKNMEKVQLSLEANAPTAETASLLIALLDQLIYDCR